MHCIAMLFLNRMAWLLFVVLLNMLTNKINPLGIGMVMVLDWYMYWYGVMNVSVRVSRITILCQDFMCQGLFSFILKYLPNRVINATYVMD